MLTLDQVKLKSMPKIEKLHPVLVAATLALIERCYARGVNIVITQGLRTTAEQNGLFAQGRTQSELNAAGLPNVKAQPDKPKVTNAKGGTSYHNYGVAIDFALLLSNGSSVSWDTARDGDEDSVADWMEVVDEANKLGFEWGGDWTSFKDLPHLQMTFGLSIKQLRAGQKPTETAMAKALANIERYMKEADELSAEDKKRIDALEGVVKDLATSRDVLKEQALKQAVEIKELSAMLVELTDTAPPEWAKSALAAFANTPSVLNGKPVIDTPEKATYTEARVFTVLHRLGLAATQKGGA